MVQKKTNVDNGKRKTPFAILEVRSANCTSKQREVIQKLNDVNSLSHSSWNYKCVVFASKYRRKVFFGEKRREIGSILRALCNWKGDQEHRSGDVPRPHPHADGDAAKDSVSRFMGILKGKSRLMLTRSFRN